MVIHKGNVTFAQGRDGGSYKSGISNLTCTSLGVLIEESFNLAPLEARYELGHHLARQTSQITIV